MHPSNHKFANASHRGGVAQTTYTTILEKETYTLSIPYGSIKGSSNEEPLLRFDNI